MLLLLVLLCLIKRHFSWLTSRALLCDSSVLALAQNERKLNTSPGLSLQQAELEQYFWALFLSNTQGYMLHYIGNTEKYKIVKLSKCSFLVQAFFLDSTKHVYTWGLYPVVWAPQWLDHKTQGQ